MVAGQIRIQVMSDLHLDTHPIYEYDFLTTAPYLALLGDIGHVVNDQLKKFLVRQLLRYRVVFFLLGNHEPYHTSWDYAEQTMNKLVRTAERLRENDPSIGEFVFLDKTIFDLTDNITVLGCTLFSRVSSEQAAAAVQFRMVDFRDIVDWDVEDHVDAHLEDLQWLNSQVADLASSRRIIIFTHHSPSVDRRARNPKYPKSEVDSGFATDLSKE